MESRLHRRAPMDPADVVSHTDITDAIEPQLQLELNLASPLPTVATLPAEGTTPLSAYASTTVNLAQPLPAPKTLPASEITAPVSASERTNVDRALSPMSAGGRPPPAAIVSDFRACRTALDEEALSVADQQVMNPSRLTRVHNPSFEEALSVAVRQLTTTTSSLANFRARLDAAAREGGEAAAAEQVLYLCLMSRFGLTNLVRPGCFPSKVNGVVPRTQHVNLSIVSQPN